MEEAISSIPHLIEGLSVTIQVTLLVVFFATIIGVILGTYSSLFVASPLVLELDTKKTTK